MKKLKGPDLKMPDLKMPAFLADLYYDLRDRRLLPLIGLVVVAIVAVPILLGGSEPEVPPPVALGSGDGRSETASASLAVVEAKPGLRDYRKRLGSRTPTDPFKQRYTGLPESAQLEVTAESSSASGSSGSGTGVTLEVEETGETTETVPSGSAPPSGGDGGTSPGSGSAGGDSDQHFYAYRPTIRFGVAGSDELSVYEHMPLGKLLPQEKPVMVFIGASEDGNRVAFNLTREVTWVRGPGRCVGGKEECSLLILRAGQAVDVLTESGRTFRLDVVRIEFVKVERPKPAGSSSARGRGSLAGFQNFSK